MSNNIEEIDKLIKETLTAEEAKFYTDLEEQNILQMILGVFKGKNKWPMLFMNLITILFFVFFIYCVVNFFKANEVSQIIKWSTGSIISFIAVSMLKIFGWLQMHKNAISREIKRLELMFLFNKSN